MSDQEEKFASWHSEELVPKHSTVTSATLAYPATITVESDYFRDGDMIAFPRTGDRAFVTGVERGRLTLDSRHIRYVDQRYTHTTEEWNGDDWIPVDHYEPEPIPHYYVRNIVAESGDEVLKLGSEYRA